MLRARKKVKAVDNSFIKLFRNLLNWRWYKNLVVKCVFIHCLLKANWKDGEWEDISVKPGEFITSREKFAEEVGLTPRQVYYAWTKLEQTGEITKVGTSRFTKIIVNNWDKHQPKQNQDVQQMYNDCTTDVQQMYTIEEYKEYKEIDSMKDRLINNKELCEKLGFYTLSDRQCLVIKEEWMKHKTLKEIYEIVERSKEHNPKNLFSYVHTIIMNSEPKEKINLIDYDWWDEEDE